MWSFPFKLQHNIQNVTNAENAMLRYFIECNLFTAIHSSVIDLSSNSMWAPQNKTRIIPSKNSVDCPKKSRNHICSTYTHIDNTHHRG